jgi:hypothetical protein
MTMRRIAVAVLGTLLACRAPAGEKLTQPEAEAAVTAALPELEAIRGLTFKKKVPVKVVDDAKARAYALARFKRMTPEAKIAADEAVTLSKDVRFDLNRAFVTSNFLVQQQDKLAQARGDIAQGYIQIYKALGGGWEIRLPAAPAPAPVPIPNAAPAPKVPPVGPEKGAEATKPLLPQATSNAASSRGAVENYIKNNYVK